MKGHMSRKSSDACVVPVAAIGGLVALLLLSACGTMPERAPSPVLYDFGAGLAEPPTVSPAARPALALSVQASSALDGTAVLYRLAYADERQLRAYALARWTMPPAELVQQRLRAALSRQRAVLRPGEGALEVLHLELEEFSQVFESPGQSQGLLRLRATVLQGTPSGDKLVAQRSVVVRHPAPSADAAGGARALAGATDAAVAELAQWLQTLR